MSSQVMLTRLSKQHRDRENNKGLYELLVIVVVERERESSRLCNGKETVYVCVWIRKDRYENQRTYIYNRNAVS